MCEVDFPSPLSSKTMFSEVQEFAVEETFGQACSYLGPFWTLLNSLLRLNLVVLLKPGASFGLSKPGCQNKCHLDLNQKQSVKCIFDFKVSVHKKNTTDFIQLSPKLYSCFLVPFLEGKILYFGPSSTFSQKSQSLLSHAICSPSILYYTINNDLTYLQTCRGRKIKPT